jgi:hypothetical protein
MSPFQLLIDKIHEGRNPYTGFPAGEWAGTWYGDPGAQRAIFGQSMELTKPGIIIEVGSFVGESAIHMAKIIKSRGLDAAILCIDTFYAGYDHFLGAREKIRLRFGRPDFYEKFIANVIQNECQNVIVPFCIDSINGARVIKWLGLVPQFLYIDASHEQGDTYRDYVAYWDLLPPGGGMLCDDLSRHFPGVIHDYEMFIKGHNLSPVLTEGEKQLLIKS